MIRQILPLAAAVLLTSTLAPLPAQEQPQGEFHGEVTVQEVLVDALVTDSHGNVVLGLDKNDFVVEENGKPVELNSATFYSNRRFLASSQSAEKLGVDPAEVPVNRYFILFFHDQRQLLPRLGAQQLDAARWTERWVREQLLPNDYVAVVRYQYKLHLYQDFTTDKEAIVKAIDAAVTAKEGGANWPSRQAAGEGPSLAKYIPTGKELRKSTYRIYDALQLVAQAAGHTRGRKNLVLFSIGFGRINDFGAYTPDVRYYPVTERTLNANNVAVYSIDLIPGTVVDSAEAVLNSSLSELSQDTGGRYYSDFVNFQTPLEKMSQDNNGYYLLSYTARHPAGSSGYQKVTVDTKNPEFKVRARQGYYYGQ